MRFNKARDLYIAVAIWLSIVSGFFILRNRIQRRAELVVCLWNGYFTSSLVVVVIRIPIKNIVSLTSFWHNIHGYYITCVTQSRISCAHNTVGSNIWLLNYIWLLVVGAVDRLIASQAIIVWLAAMVLSWLKVGRLLGLIFCINKLI